MPRDDQVRAIERLKARYFRLLDTKDWDGLATVFTDDVVVDSTGEGAGVTRGPEPFIELLRSMLGEATTVHHGHMPEILLTSPLREASGIWAMDDEIWWPAGAPIVHLRGWGHYHETYRRHSSGWRIETMRITRLRRVIDLPDGTQVIT